MIFRGLLVFIIISMVSSCDFIGSAFLGSTSNYSMDTIINYNRVDELPIFPACDTLIDTGLKNNCFKNSLFEHFSKNLRKETFGVTECLDETVMVRIKIDSKGVTSLESIEASDVAKMAVPKLDSLLLESIHSLPVLFPALKRGIPVNIVFELPIVIKLK